MMSRGIFFFELFQRSHVAEHPLLGVLPHGAGIEEDQVGLLHILTDAKAGIQQYAADFFAVVDVLLTAVAVYIGHGRAVVKPGNDRGCLGVMGIGKVFQCFAPCV